MKKNYCFAFLIGVIIAIAIIAVVTRTSPIPSGMEAINVDGMVVTYPKSHQELEQNMKNDDAEELGEVTMLWPDKKSKVRNSDEITFTVTTTGDKGLSKNDVDSEYFDCKSIKKISEDTYEVSVVVENITMTTAFEYSIGNSNGVLLYGSVS